MDRDGFIKLAGGLPKTPGARNYRARRFQQKYFWKFFSAPARRKSVKSIYSEFTVDALLRKQAYSIEHIVPKSFLRAQLIAPHPSAKYRFNATINPFNYAVSHRKVNAYRSSMQYDMEDDPVLRRNKKIASNIGIDHEGEWIVPKRSRGVVARAIVYMAIMYGLNKVGDYSIEKYASWVLAHKPQLWEIEYNRWIKKKYNICNPLIEICNRHHPDLFFNNGQLFESIYTYTKNQSL